jgi:hypothetical protein
MAQRRGSYSQRIVARGGHSAMARPRGYRRIVTRGDIARWRCPEDINGSSQSGHSAKARPRENRRPESSQGEHSAKAQPRGYATNHAKGTLRDGAVQRIGDSNRREGDIARRRSPEDMRRIVARGGA